MSKTTPFPLGVYVGGLSTDPTAEAVVEKQYAAFTNTLGATPAYMDVFIDQNKPVSGWAGDAGYTAYAWRTSGIAQTTIPVLGLPMASAADRGNQDAVFKAFAAGTYDDTLRGIVSAWQSNGYSTLYVRPGYEGNGDFVPWYAGSDPQTRADWVAAFQHIATVMRSVPGSDVKIVWNPNIQAGNTGDVKALYPGDKYVDVIAGDIYSPTYPRDLYDWDRNDGTYDQTLAQWASDPINRTHYWTYPAANKYTLNDGQSNTFSLQDLIDFAKAHGKPIGIGETGAGGDGTRGPSDDPAFAQWLASTLSNAGVPVQFVNIWDTNPGDGNWDFSSATAPKPQEAAAWARYFGAYVAPITVGSGTSKIVLGVSEDAYAGHAMFTVRVDGVQVGGTLTATASHASGQSQVVNVLGSFAPGPHSVTVQFLNDAYAGPGQDRNLYVDTIQYGGSTAQMNAAFMSAGTQTFGVVGAAPTGSGSDTLVLHLSEDAYAGDALFSATVDGVVVAGAQAVTALHGQSSQTVTIHGSFGSGAHKVEVSFLNDLYGGSAATDRNLYVDDVSVNGIEATAPKASLYSAGTAAFMVPAPPASGTGDTVTFNLSEDYWTADAQAIISLDGKILANPATVTASHALGLTQKMSFTGNFGAGPHTAVVQFLNDAYGGPGQDRNLYVDGIDFNGAHTGVTPAALMRNGSASLTFTVTTPTTTQAPTGSPPSSVTAMIGQT